MINELPSMPGTTRTTRVPSTVDVMMCEVILYGLSCCSMGSVQLQQHPEAACQACLRFISHLLSCQCMLVSWLLGLLVGTYCKRSVWCARMLSELGRGSSHVIARLSDQPVLASTKTNQLHCFDSVFGCSQGIFIHTSLKRLLEKI